VQGLGDVHHVGDHSLDTVTTSLNLSVGVVRSGGSVELIRSVGQG
jgi:hypothetical protein